MSALRTRDLSSHDLWERSLNRSRERRRVAAIHRKTAPRRKGVSLAISAALLTTPILPSFAAAQSGGGPAPTSGTGGDDQGRPAPPTSLLKIGSTGSAVRQIQRALGLIDDGIYGPQTREAVLRFQRHAGMSITGKVDNGTWMAIFSSNVTVLDAGTPEAAAVQTAAGDVPVEAAPATSTVPAVADDDPIAAEPAVFVQNDAPAEPKRQKKTTRSRGDDSATTPKRKRTRSERSDPGSGSRTPSKDRKKTSTKDTGDSNSSSCGGFGTPVNGTVTGVFGEDRGGRSHQGLDIAAPSGTPIKAATCGRVSTVEYQGGYGNIVCIRASSSFTTCYAHMSRFGTSVGKYVRIGEVIGYVGSTGNSTGPHVHFEVRINGSQVNPQPYLNGSKKPGRSMAVRYEAAHEKGSAKKADTKTDKGTAAIVREQRDANREAGGVPAPPEPTPEQQQAQPQPVQAAPPAAGPEETPVAPEQGAPEQAAPPVDDGSGAPAVDDTVTTPVDDGSGVVEDTTGAVDDTIDETGVTDDTTGDGITEDPGSTEDGSSDDAGSTGEESSDDGSGVADDTTGVVDDTTGTVDDTVGDVTTEDPAAEDPALEDTSGEDTSGAEDPAPEDTSGEDASGAEDSAPEDTSSEDTSGEDASEGEEPATEDTSGDDGSSEPTVTEDPAGAAQDTVEDTTAVPAGG